MTDIGNEMHSLCRRLFPICRSITGDGVRQTLSILQEHVPLDVSEIPSGTEVFDWIVPREWNIREAYIETEAGERIVDFQENNLHVVGYSIPVDKQMSLDELQTHLHSLEDLPDAIPYVTSYYQERWGFCLQHAQRESLPQGSYHVFIDSDLKDGHLTYGELVLPGKSKEEVFISTYICHPSMANNELSGPVVATFLAAWLQEQALEKTYRIVFIPETIGAITYLSRNLDALQENVIIGFNLTCIGDDRAYSFVRSRYGNTYADRVIQSVFQSSVPEFKAYSYLERGSDERQYGSPLVDLPLVTICRSKFGAFPEYHTSLDDLNLVTPAGLAGSLAVLKECIYVIENNQVYRAVFPGEPQLGKRGLYPTLSKTGSADQVKSMMNLLAYADGRNDLLAIAEIIQVDFKDLAPIAQTLVGEGLLEVVTQR